MNENEFRDALRRVRPVEIDDAMVTTVVRQARMRRRRRWLAGVSAAVMLAVAAGTGVVWNTTREEPVAVPDPRGGPVQQPNQTVPAETTTPPYTGDLSYLPASYGTSSPTVPGGQGWTEQDVGIYVCAGTDDRPNQVTALRGLAAAQTKVNGDMFQSALRFATPQDANMFVGELQRIQSQCELRYPTANQAGAEARTRLLPSQAQSAVDDGMVVGYRTVNVDGDQYVAGVAGTVYQVGRRGDVVAISGAVNAGDLAGIADARSDEPHAQAIVSMVASATSVSNLPYAGDLTVLPARYQTGSVRLPHEGTGGALSWVFESVPLAICPTHETRGNTFLTLNGVTGARTLSQPESTQFESVLDFADAEKASRFMLELASTKGSCGDRAATADVPGFRTGKRDLPAAAAAVADEGFVIGYQGTILEGGVEQGTTASLVYYVARKGSRVVVVGSGIVGPDAMQPSSADAERSQTIVAVLR